MHCVRGWVSYVLFLSVLVVLLALGSSEVVAQDHLLTPLFFLMFCFAGQVLEPAVHLACGLLDPHARDASGIVGDQRVCRND